MVDTDPKLPHRAEGAGEMLLSRNRRGYWHEFPAPTCIADGTFHANRPRSAGAVGFRGRLMEMRPSRVRRWLGRVAGRTMVMICRCLLER